MEQQNSITPSQNVKLENVSLLADDLARKNSFIDYRSRKSINTLKAHDHDLKLFHEIMKSSGIPDGRQLATNPNSWNGVSFGLIEAFKISLLNEGYAIGTINRTLSTIKVYAKLAFKADAISHEVYALMRTVSGYTQKEAKHINEKRIKDNLQTRRLDNNNREHKKAEHTRLALSDVYTLKIMPQITPDDITATVRRDMLLMCLLLDHGLRCGEVARLKVGNIDIEAGQLKFYRPKVDKVQTHDLTADILKVARAYFQAGHALKDDDAPLIRGSRKGGYLTENGMSERAITKRVKYLGKMLIDKENLSAHDCRHSWATRASKSGTNPFALQQAGGWSSVAMPRRYVEDNRIANKGVKLDEDIESYVN